MPAARRVAATWARPVLRSLPNTAMSCRTMKYLPLPHPTSATSDPAASPSMNCRTCQETNMVVNDSTAQHSTAQHSTAQHSTAQHSTAQHSTAQHSTAQHSTAQHSTAQHSTAQHSTAQHSTAQHSTAQAQHMAARIARTVQGTFTQHASNAHKNLMYSRFRS